MVMATGSVCPQIPADELSHEAGEASEAGDEASVDAAALHERLVAYVHALAGGNEPRSGVWVEHSYARARGAAHASAAHVRVLLAPRLEPELGEPDVERAEPPPPEPAALSEPEPDSDGDDDADADDDWEARVAALAPSAAHARLASLALDALRRMRLEQLVAMRGCARAEAARAAARRLRLALASAAAHPHAQRPAAWLHAALHAYMPRKERRLWAEAVRELRRAAPRLAERMAGACSPPRPARPAPAAPGGPWLLWVGGGRWPRRLRALLPTRVLATGAAPAAAAPEAWCAAAAAGVRTALADALLEAGERAVVLGGAGAGAALCVWLARAGGTAAARVRGLLLLAPPLLTAEGPRDTPDDPLAEIRLPMLVVAGTAAAQSWRGAVREVARRGAGGARRVLELRGADDALRLPAELRRRRRLPQHALDAAVAEECARWATETALGERGDSPRRAADDEEEYAHLPAAAAAAAGSDRPIQIVGDFPARRGTNSTVDASNSMTLVEGRVVSRGQGGTPLALLPPRRAAPPAPALAAADIMRLPIVFADDAPEAEAPPSPVTVTAGAARFARVIVASRGHPARPPGPPAPRPPVLLRRGVRLVPHPHT